MSLVSAFKNFLPKILPWSIPIILGGLAGYGAYKLTERIAPRVYNDEQERRKRKNIVESKKYAQIENELTKLSETSEGSNLEKASFYSELGDELNQYKVYKESGYTKGGYKPGQEKVMVSDEEAFQNLLKNSSSISNKHLKSIIEKYKQANGYQSSENNDIIKTVEKAAVQTGVDQNTMLSFAQLESNMGKNTTPHKGSAKGLFQFMPDTWKSVTRKYGKKYGIDENSDPNDPQANALMAGELLKENEQGLKNLGISDINHSELYWAHMLGPKTASKLITGIRENPNMKARDVLPSSAIEYNPGVFGQGGEYSLRQVQQNIESRFEKTGYVTNRIKDRQNLNSGALALEQVKNQSNKTVAQTQPNNNVGINNTTNYIQQPDMRYFVDDIYLRQNLNMGLA